MTSEPLPGRPLLTTPAIREIERRGLAATAPGTLMARAADAVAAACATLLRRLPARTPVLALAGPGNNGGDALLAALRLAERGWAVRALALSPDEPAAEDARRAWRAWQATGRPIGRPADAPAALSDAPLVIDGLFGIGLARPLPPPAAALAEAVAAAGLTVVAVDVPSGLDADRGAIVGGGAGRAIRADVTVTMIADKPGLHTGAGPGLAGRVVVAGLGLDAEPARGSAPSGTLYDGEPLGRLLPARAPDAHKGRFGDLLVIAGAPAMRGATTLAVLGAQAVGCGRLYVGLDEDLPADPSHPEVMSRRIAPDHPDPRRALGTADAIVIGCGLGGGPGATARLMAALAHPAALVLDADGLNAIAADPALEARLQARAGSGARTVLTPHPLEAARLLGTDTGSVQGDRIAAATAIARRLGGVVVLKGAGSVIASPDGRWSLNASGGPLLSVAGTGDVLAGVIGGLLAGGLGAEEAARVGAWLHGAAADRLAALPGWSRGIGLPASRLPDAIRETVNRPVDRS